MLFQRKKTKKIVTQNKFRVDGQTKSPCEKEN